MQLIRIFFPIVCLITYCTGYSYVEAWFGHCITSVQYIVISPKMNTFGTGHKDAGLSVIMARGRDT